MTDALELDPDHAPPDAHPEIVERVLALLDAGTTHMASAEHVRDARAYHDPAAFGDELRHVFRASPLVAAHGSQLRAPGDFVTLEMGGVPIVLVRDKASALRAYVNVCRHRGTRLVGDACGHDRRAFVCPYHGWAYDLEGSLFHIPHAEGFNHVDKATMSLAAVPVAEAFGFVWIRLAPNGVVDRSRSSSPPRLDPVAEVGPELARDLEALDLGSHVVYRPRSFTKPINWKLAIDVFLEAYHVKRTHQESIYPLFFDNVALFDAFGRHLRNAFPKRSIEGLRGTARGAWRARDHVNLLYLLFPNTLLLVEPDHAAVFHVAPTGVASSRITAYTLIPRGSGEALTDKARRYWDKNVEILANAVEEDFAMAESIQAGLTSGANATFTFGRFEQALGVFHRAVDAAVELGRSANAPAKGADP